MRNSATILVSSATALDTVTGYIAEPHDIERQRLGVFFILLKADDIPSLVPWVEPLAQYLAATYYRVLEEEPQATVERALGVTRQRAKLRLQQLVQQTRTITITGVHYCFGSLRGRSLSLTHTGAVRALLLHQKQRDKSTVTKWIDITGTGGSISSPQKPTPPHTPTVISGVIGEDDTIVIATESVFDTLGLKKMERLIQSEPLEGASALLERDVRTLSSRLSFGALFLRRPYLPAEKRNRDGVTTSMQHLRQKESGTADLLTPSSPSLLKRLWQFPQNIRHRPGTTEERTAESGQRLAQLLKGMAERLLGIATALVVRPLRLLVSLSQSQKRQDFILSLQQAPHRLVGWSVSKIRQLPHPSQRLLLVAVLFAFLFIQSLVFLAERKTRTAITSGNTALVTTIQDELDQAEAAMIYHNDTQAATLFIEATQQLQLLPQQSTTDKERFVLLQNRLNELHTKLAKLSSVTSLTKVAEVTDAHFQSNVGLIANGQNLFVYSSDGTVATLNAKTNVLDTVAQPTGTARIIRGMVDDKGQTALLSDAPSVFHVEVATKSLQELTIASPPKDVADGSFYHNRLYLLDPKGGQVSRHQAATGSYQAGTPWIRGVASDLSTATSLAIDGDVYVLLEDGSIDKFTNGLKQTWQGQRPLDQAQHAAHLALPSSVPLLFAMDAGSKRVIVWNRDTGALVRQFIFPNLAALNDFAIDDKGQTLTLLSSDGIYKTSISL